LRAEAVHEVTDGLRTVTGLTGTLALDGLALSFAPGVGKPVDECEADDGAGW
jgi:hypothetical protein